MKYLYAIIVLTLLAGCSTETHVVNDKEYRENTPIRTQQDADEIMYDLMEELDKCEYGDYDCLDEVQRKGESILGN